MPEVNATVRFGGAVAEIRQRELDRKSADERFPNLVDFSSDPNISRKPDYFIYVYNAGPRSFDLQCAPLAPVVHVPPCPPEKPFVVVAAIPNIINQQSVADPATGSLRNDGFRGEWLANDIVCPGNPQSAKDCWTEMKDTLNIGNNLTYRGVFWSYSAPPREGEEPSPELARDIARAKARVAAHYQNLIKEADRLYAADPTNGNGAITPEHHLAADFFRQQTPWHRVYEAPASCPICGDDIKPGIAFHRNAAGTFCILDAKRAAAAGVKNSSTAA